MPSASEMARLEAERADDRQGVEIDRKLGDVWPGQVHQVPEAAIVEAIAALAGAEAVLGDIANLRHARRQLENIRDGR